LLVTVQPDAIRIVPMHKVRYRAIATIVVS